MRTSIEPIVRPREKAFNYYYTVGIRSYRPTVQIRGSFSLPISFLRSYNRSVRGKVDTDSGRSWSDTN